MRWGLKKHDDSLNTSLDSFRREMDSVFDDFFSLKKSSLFDSEWLPKLDVEENDKEFHISAELPGIEEKDINVTLEKNMLTISGEKKTEREEKDDKRKSYYAERHYGSFSRSIALPEEIVGDKAQAKFKNGVLIITVPKNEKAVQKRLSIKVN